MCWQSEDLAQAWARAIENPEALTIAEMIQLSGFLWSFLDQLDASRVWWDLEVSREPLPSMADNISYNAGVFFGNEFSQAWWVERGSEIHPEIAALIDQEIENAASNNLLRS